MKVSVHLFDIHVLHDLFGLHGSDLILQQFILALKVLGRKNEVLLTECVRLLIQKACIEILGRRNQAWIVDGWGVCCRYWCVTHQLPARSICKC